jgi:zinc protease
MRLTHTLAIAASLSLAQCAGTALAQDSGGQPSGSTSGAVIKGKAPVAKELLKIKFPKPKSFKLSNGVTVYVLEDHRFPAVRMRLIMRAGSLYEPKPGVAEMTASMMTEGTTSRTSLQLAEETSNMGAQVGVSSGSDVTTLSASGLSETLDQILGVMKDVLEHPAFPAERLDRLKFQQNSQIGQRRTNPQSLIAELANKTYYGGTPYERHSPKGNEIEAITREDLAKFHDQYYVPNGALLGVTGDVNPAALKEKLEAALNDWKPSQTLTALPAATFHPKEATKVYLIDRPGSAQTVLQFGNVAVKQNDPDYLALVVANRVLGGGSSGRLFQNIRERKGYTYGAYSTLAAGKWPGVWGASASVRTPVTEPATAEFFFEFNRLQDELVPAEELERAKRSIVGSFAGALESPDAILTRTLDLVENGLPMDYWDTYPAKIQAVSAEDVQRVARKYLGKNRIQLFAVGERSQIEAGLKKFGPVEIVDASQLTGAGGGGRRGR